MKFQTLEQLMVASAEAIRPADRLTVSQAAERYRYLYNPGSYVGYWNNKKAPYLVEPMDVLTGLTYQGMIFAGPARCGKSDLFFNWLAHTVVCDPADMMLVAMTQHVARDWSQADLARMLRHSKEVGERIAPGKQNRNVHDIRFMSGMRLLVKWPTITELSGKTIPRLWLQDYDRMTQDVDGEGNPYDLTAKRATTFKRHAMTVAEASPGFAVEDAKWIARTPHEAPPCKGILSLYNRGDRRRWMWRCPHCWEPFEGDFTNLQWPKSKDKVEAAERVVMICPKNGCVIEPSFKQELNEGGKWIKDGQVWLTDGSVAGEASRSNTASFWLKGPAALFVDWQTLVLKYLSAMEDFEANGSEEALKTTTNTDQGLPYTYKAMQSDRLPEELKARAQDWGGTPDDPVVPLGVRFLIATVDVQKLSFVVQVHGVGEGGDIWFIDMFKIRKSVRLDKDGDPLPLDPAAYPEDFHVLIDQVMEKTYRVGDGSGRRMAIKMTGCDSGGMAGVTTNIVNFYRWLRDKDARGLQKRFMLLKGEPHPSHPPIRVGFPESSRKDRNSGLRGDVPVLFINSNKLKDQAAGMLGRIDPADGSITIVGGQVNFPKWTEGFIYTQLTSEIRTAKGWENPRRARNEAFDLLYYCLALCLHSSINLTNINWAKPPSWAAEWGENDFVLDDGVNKPFEKQPRGVRTLSKLAEALA